MNGTLGNCFGVRATQINQYSPTHYNFQNRGSEAVNKPNPPVERKCESTLFTLVGQVAQALLLRSVAAQSPSPLIALRVWDVLTMLRHAIRNSTPGQNRLPFALYVRNDNRRPRLIKLIATCGVLDFDDPTPAITIAMPDDD